MQEAQEKLGKRIRKLREKKGLSQEFFAGLCDINRVHMSQIERGQIADTLVEFGRTLEIGKQEGQAGDFEMLLNIDNIYAVGISKHLVRQQSLGSQKGLVPVHHVLGSLLDPQSRQYPSVGAVLKQ